MKNRMITFLLALAMILAVTACEKITTDGATTAPTATQAATTAPTAEPTATPKYPTYLNLDSTLPVIKDGEGADITLTAVMQRAAGGGDWEDLWLAKYMEEYMNIRLDVTQIDSSALNERKSLMFAAEDLPDLLMGLGLSTGEIVNYGQLNGQLLAIDNYLDRELVPELSFWFEDERPDVKLICTTPDGHIYTLPMIREITDEGGIPRIFINQLWLDACKLKTPTTLDDFLAMARMFKEQDPGGVGVENVIPLGGGFDFQNLGFYFLNAMGYVLERSTDNCCGLGISIRNGEAEFPCGNAELFYEYLKIMKDCYDEGLFSPDFFTLDATAVNAQLNSGYLGVYGGTVYPTGLPTWRDWWSVKPLTSQWSDTPVWYSPVGAYVGNFAFSAETEYPELCLRFADVFFTHDYLSRMLWVGPKDGSEEALGYVGTKLNASGNGIDWDISKFPEGKTDVMSYILGLSSVYFSTGSVNTTLCSNDYIVNYLGGTVPGFKEFDMTNADQYYRASVWKNCMPYASETFPGTIYLDAETNTRLGDLGAVIQPYVREQVALFISGDRSLDEFDDYISELSALDFDEYEQIYKDIWSTYQSLKGN